ncbi:MAG: hypothetical protein A2Y79_09360 [Deltaproteobacteria bacterium RBG_13_43_22]|nr:MAG: hypothetical protein A2Y79_09360 [Deltaproteobacteria bacterium RBG_13_43_22]
MRIRFRIILMGVILLLLWGCTTTQTLDLKYTPVNTVSPVPSQVIIAVIPFEDATWNGQENPYWVGKASLYGMKLYSPTSISYLVTQGVKKEMGSYGYQLSPDEIYTIQINKNDIKTLFQRVPHLQVDFLVGGAISHFFVQQVGTFIAEVEIEAYLARPPSGDIIWNKKIGHREVRIPFVPDKFSSQSQGIINNLMEKTLRDLFWNSDFRLYTVGDKK